MDRDPNRFIDEFCSNRCAIPSASAAEARSILERFQPDVFVSDIGLPDQDGYELIRQVRMCGHGAPGCRPSL